jgi:hypothetical protein
MTYYHWQITHFELCHRNIPTSQDTNTPEGLESQFSVRNHRIPPEPPHSTEPGFGKLHKTQMDSGRVSALELLRGLLTSWEVLQPLQPHLSLYSTKNKLGSTIGS